MNRPELLQQCRLFCALVGSFFLALWAAAEWLLAYPVAWWLYAPLVPLFAIGFLSPVAPSRQPGRILAFALLTALTALLYMVPWTSRKPFLRDLGSIRPGMSEAEVRQIMRGYIEGTGWPASPASAERENAGYGQAAAPEPLALPGSLVFRHSTNGAFNSDWGVVALENGRVTRVRFDPD